MKPTDRCWCDHQVRWHTQYTFTKPGFGLCKYCATRNLKYPNFAWPEEHEMSARVPEWMMRGEVDKLDEFIAQNFPGGSNVREEYKFTVGDVEMAATGTVLAKYLLDHKDPTGEVRQWPMYGDIVDGDNLG